MSRFAVGLVIERSQVAGALISFHLARHCSHTEVLRSLDEMRERSPEREPSLVVLDATLPGSLDWLGACAARPARPAVVLVTTRPCFEEEARATLLGAIGYLAKPLTAGALAYAIAATRGDFATAPTRVRRSPVAVASIVDVETGEDQVACEVINLSETGALLATGASGREGDRLTLRLICGTRSITLEGRIARVQQPSWELPAGWGVAFDFRDPQTRTWVRERVAELRRSPGVAC